MWIELLSVLVTALGTVIVTGINSWLSARKTAVLQQQLGAMTYDKLVQQDALERSKAAETTRNIISGLSDAEFDASVSANSDAIRSALTNKLPKGV